MATFNANAVSQLYVAEKLVTAANNRALATAVKAETVPAVGVGHKAHPASAAFNGSEATTNGVPFLFSQSALGDVLRSDLITNIININACAAGRIAGYTQKFNVASATLASAQPGTVAVGDTLILRMNLRGMFGQSDEDVYVKECAITAGSAVIATELKALVAEMKKSWAREASKDLFTFDTTNGTITENLGKHIVGVKNDACLRCRCTEVDGDISSDIQVRIISTTDEQVLQVPIVNGNKIPSGRQISDYEWFCLGNRGDQYRGVGYPNINPTKGLVDEKKDYDLISVHYAFIGDGVNPEKSEKDLLIAVLNPGTTNATYTTKDAALGQLGAQTKAILKALKPGNAYLGQDAAYNEQAKNTMA